MQWLSTPCTPDSSDFYYSHFFMYDYNFDRDVFLQTETSYARSASGVHTLTWLGISAHKKIVQRCNSNRSRLLYLNLLRILGDYLVRHRKKKKKKVY